MSEETKATKTLTSAQQKRLFETVVDISSCTGGNVDETLRELLCAKDRLDALGVEESPSWL